MDDWELLREWSERSSDEAFRTLIERHLNLVYSVARRSVPTPSQAEEVTQTAFILLAQKAGALPRGTVIAGWLYRTTRFIALEVLRSESRQQSRREELARMEAHEPDRLWEQVGPVLEETLDEIQERDRDALVLRFLEEHSLREVGAALGISEEAARKRVARGLERLRLLLARRGIATTASLLGTMLTTSAIQAAPAALASSVTAGATGAAIATSTSALLKGTLTVMAWSKAKTVTAVAAALLLCGGTAFVATQLTSAPPPAQVPAVATEPVDDTPAADDGRVGGPRNRLPEWRGQLAQAVDDEQADQVKKIWCVDNLKQIGFASYIWSTNNGRFFPSNLLHLRAHISPRYLTCPADDSRAEVTKWAGMAGTNITYMMVSPGVQKPQPNLITVRCPIHGHVALGDGRVLQEDYLRTRIVAADNTVQ